MILSPRILALRFKGSFNRRFPYHQRCLGSVFCLRLQVFYLCCWKHQDVYDKRAARRLKRARREIIKRRKMQARQLRAYRDPSGRYDGDGRFSDSNGRRL